MNKFDLNWFTTIPGLLITGGVLLLVIALIIFIITSVKGKKSKNNGSTAMAQDQVQPQAVQTPQAIPVANNGMGQPNMNVQSQVDMSNNGIQNSIPMESAPNIVTATDAGMMNLNVAPAPTIPMDANIQANSMPSLDQISNIQAPVMNQMPVENVVPTADEMLAVQQTTPIVDVSGVVAPDIPIVSNVDTISGNINNIPVTVPTQSVPNVEVVSSAPVIEGLNTLGVQDVSGSNSTVLPTEVSNISNVSVMDSVSNIPVIDSSNNSVNTPNIEVLSVADNDQIEHLTFSNNEPANSVVDSTFVNNIPANIGTPVNNVSIQESQPTPEVSIYGGVSPIVPNINSEMNQTHQIYGGANPLENTQSVPIVNIANGDSYTAQDNLVNSQVEIMQNVNQYSATPTNQVNSAVQSVEPSIQPQVTISNDIPVVPNISVDSQFNQQAIPNVQGTPIPQYTQQPVQQQVVVPQVNSQQVGVQ